MATELFNIASDTSFIRIKWIMTTLSLTNTEIFVLLTGTVDESSRKRKAIMNVNVRDDLSDNDFKNYFQKLPIPLHWLSGSSFYS
jgi:hypothetical protein